MNSTFYRDLAQMVDEAGAALERFETTGDGSAFSELRSVAAACLDGDKLLTSIRDDLGPRRLFEFQSAVYKLAGLTSLTSGRGRNPNVSSAIFTIKTAAVALEAEPAARESTSLSESEVGGTRDRHLAEYVHESRIAQLRAMPHSRLDATRLVRLLEELNDVHAAGCHMATAMLVRAITDHVPPVFGFRNFEEVASNYAGGKSLKASMQHLQSSLRHIADTHLHAQMRRKEVLPTERQIDFRADLDVLLGEIVRVLSTDP